LNPRGASTSGFRDRRLGPSLATPAFPVKPQKFNQRLFYIPIDSMKIKVKISRTNETKEISVEKGLTIEDVLKKINLKPDTVIILNKSKPIPIDDEIKDGEELTVLQVSSGG
jgi:sulfur carrier protein ThiS